MKFQPERTEGFNVISRLDGGRVWIGATPFDRSIVLPWQGTVTDWQAGAFSDLTPAHFERIVAFAPEVVIFGSGTRLRFPPASHLRALIERGIGVETMDTGAACRTYNVLASERRSVVAALLLEAPTP